MNNKHLAEAIFHGLNAGPFDGDELDDGGDGVDIIQSHAGHWTVYSAGISMEEHHRNLEQAQEWAHENNHTINNIIPWGQQ